MLEAVRSYLPLSTNKKLIKYTKYYISVYQSAYLGCPSMLLK